MNFKELLIEYEEKLCMGIEVYKVFDGNEFLGYIARKVMRDMYGIYYYGYFSKADKNYIKTTVWNFGGDKFYE